MWTWNSSFLDGQETNFNVEKKWLADDDSTSRYAEEYDSNPNRDHQLS